MNIKVKCNIIKQLYESYEYIMLELCMWTKVNESHCRQLHLSTENS